jgi:hypothetical protein
LRQLGLRQLFIRSPYHRRHGIFLIRSENP